MDQLLMRLPVIGDGASVSVETATRADASELSRLLSEAFEQPWDERWVLENLLDDHTVVATYVLRCEQRVVATASARLLPGQFPEAGYVHFVATDPAARGRGLAVPVTRAVLDRFRSMGLTQAVLETDDERLRAISTYLGMGFVPEYRSPEHLLRWSHVFASLKRRPSPTGAQDGR